RRRPPGWPPKGRGYDRTTDVARPGAGDGHGARPLPGTLEASGPCQLRELRTLPRHRRRGALTHPTPCTRSGRGYVRRPLARLPRCPPHAGARMSEVRATVVGRVYYVDIPEDEIMPDFDAMADALARHVPSFEGVESTGARLAFVVTVEV